MNSSNSSLRVGSLVLYKQKAAQILKIDPKKIEINVLDGKKSNVRDKDVTLLHSGPLNSLADLQKTPAGDVNAAWELLQGEAYTTITELAEWIYDESTPATTWATWQWIADGLYFSGTPQEITIHDADTVAQIQAGRAAKEAEEEAWQAFVSRARQDQFGQYPKRGKCP